MSVRASAVLRVGLVTTCLVLAGVPAVADRTAAEVRDSVPLAELGPEAAAAAAASSTGRPVEVESLTTPTSLTTANPDGSFTTEVSGVAVRAHTEDGWSDIDTTLVLQEDGTIAPRVATLDYSFSAGGQDPMVSVSAAGTELAWSWPGRLPTPRLDGDTATYADVLPGVDLQMRAGPDGFSHVLVVEDAEAAANPALSELSFDSVVERGTIVPQQDGGLVLRDAGGEAVLQSPAPVMWDSAGSTVGDRSGEDDNDHAPGEGDVVAAIDTVVSADDQVVLVPDSGMLAADDTVFPVYIDPVWSSATQTMRVMVNASFPTTSYTNWTSADEGVGHIVENGSHVKRLYWNFNTQPFIGKHIVSATFSAYQTHSYSCTPSNVRLWLTHAFGAGHTWNNAPAPIRHVGTRSTALGRSGCTLGGARVEFDATSVAQDVTSYSWPGVGLALIAENESDQNSWKRFRSDAIFSVQYQNPPTIPTGLAMQHPTRTCATGANRPVVGVASPTATVTASDPDGDNVRVEYGLARTGNPAFIWSVITGYQGSGTGFGASLPLGTFGQGTYSWRTRAHDPYGAVSAWSPWCEVTYDATAPLAPTVSSALFLRDGLEHGNAGTQGPFTFTPAAGTGGSDVGQFRWSWTGSMPTTCAPGRCVTGPAGAASGAYLSPPRHGLNTLSVWAIDAAGWPSPKVDYTFKAGQAMPFIRYTFDEPNGSRALDTTRRAEGVFATGSNTVVTPVRTTVPATVLGTGPGNLAVEFGTTTQPDLRMSTKLTSHGIDTTGSYTVAAWVRSDDVMSMQRTAVSIDATSAATFALGHTMDDGSGGRVWAFSRATQDAADPKWDRVKSTIPAVNGEWVFLAASIDASAPDDPRVTFWVDDTPFEDIGPDDGTTDVKPGIAGAGHIRIGRSDGNDQPSTGGLATPYFKGGIAEVRFYQGALDETAIQRMRLGGLTNTDGVVTDTLMAGTMLTSDTKITSKNGQHRLVMQGDGNLVLLTGPSTVRWHTNTHGNPGAFFAVQGDGNLVIYPTAGPYLWASVQYSRTSRLVVQDDGNLVLYDAGNAVLWQTNTGGA